MASKIKVHRILELRDQGLTYNEIASTYHISKHSIVAVCRKAEDLGVRWADVRGKTEEEIYSLFFPSKAGANTHYENPDYEYVHSELKKTGVTLRVLHEEYCEECRHKGLLFFSYSRFCKGYTDYVGTKNISSHINHKPGDRIEVDWSGPTMHYYDVYSGKQVTVYLFVADLVYSRMAYVEPTLHMDEATWLNCHINMWEYFGGVSRLTICDNLKTGVLKHPKEGDIILNPEYEALAAYYGTAILPADVRAPRQKNSTEGTVGNIATDIIARLRNTEFSSFESLKKAVAKKLQEHNEAPFQKREGSRKSIFDEEEKSSLRSLQEIRYEVGVWVYGRKIQLNSHIAFEKNFYSCPYIYIGRTVDLKVTPNSVIIYLEKERIKTHVRFPENVKNKYRTDAIDLPNGLHFTEWTADRIISWGSTIGSCSKTVVERILSSQEFPEQSFNSALAVLRLAKNYGSDRLEKACEIALNKVTVPRYANLKAILSSQQDVEFVNKKAVDALSIKGCLRGADYYSSLKSHKEEEK